ncbi:peptidoglycan-binding protein [Anaerofilum sp. An201]|uniref:peptidoglycan-binding domain-containing protein n=1 Tax=uncultured Subdoligranulum sp. TaxID=512298 RepID=UPI000B395FD2|nr:peptidoglycan-binding domain-containing protein [Anaerofilum sp. An201]OUP02958.1 peptidase [Anaerofilum sp. An201]HIX13574.1 peptidoglycan-binding protein [Candidatus Anaerofilum faecale]
MAKLFVYDEYTNKLLTYQLSENDVMPFVYGSTMRLREFRGSSKSPTLWTTIRAMEAWNMTRRSYGRGIHIGYAFKRIWEGGHGTASQHYAGVAFDVGQNTTSANRRQIWNAASNTGAWGYVEPLSMTPTWVHFDRRYFTPACSGTTAGYPTLRRGSVSTYVLILQDALNALGYNTNTLDGKFGSNTERAVRAFQSNVSLAVDGIVGCNTWKKLTAASVGIGRTSTVID